MLPILFYLISEMERIKERAYLARYLVKINVPPEMVQSDEGINIAWEEYLELIERFKEIHSSVNEQRKQVRFLFVYSSGKLKIQGTRHRRRQSRYSVDGRGTEAD